MFTNISKPYQPQKSYRCPCCGYKTLHERGGYEICPVCYWEDDGQDEHDANEVRGGPNGTLSLEKARANFVILRACDGRFVDITRAATEDEV